MQNNSFTNQLESYFSIITTKVNFVNQVKKEYSKILASDFNSLDFLYFGEICWLKTKNVASHFIKFSFSFVYLFTY